MIEVDLDTLAKQAPERFKGMWAEMKRDLNINDDYHDIFEAVYCHGYCRALSVIAEMIERENIKPQAIC